MIKFDSYFSDGWFNHQLTIVFGMGNFVVFWGDGGSWLDFIKLFDLRFYSLINIMLQQVLRCLSILQHLRYEGIKETEGSIRARDASYDCKLT